MLVLQLVFVITVHTALAVEKEFYDVDSSEQVLDLFKNFLHDFNKSYTGTEELVRKQIFRNTLVELNQLNEKHPLTVFGITFFADLTAEEMKAYKGLAIPKGVPHQGSCQVKGDLSSHDAPESFDWRTKGAVTPIRSQKFCGSCWAFSATAIVESKLAIQKGRMLDLSEQQLVDCDLSSFGCGGGWPANALSYIIVNGQESEADYPYVAKNSVCKGDRSKSQVKVASCNSFSLSNEDAMKEVLFKEGPLSIVIATLALGGYTGGICTDCADRRLDHAVELVGYGSENGTDFWIMKNSWGTQWGENGFFRIQRGVQCLGLLNNYIASVNIE